MPRVLVLAVVFAVGCGKADNAEKEGEEAGPVFRDKTVPAWLRALSDPDPKTRQEAKEALVSAGRPAVRGLVEELKNPDPGVRQAAAGALGEIGPAARVAAPALREALQDPSPGVRAAAERALKRVDR
jgi:HEAT repeat protein